MNELGELYELGELVDRGDRADMLAGGLLLAQVWEGRPFKKKSVLVKHINEQVQSEGIYLNQGGILLIDFSL